ncbi:hypothetical protein B7463_g7733, partial [Scytalidium lignicola]
MSEFITNDGRRPIASELAEIPEKDDKYMEPKELSPRVTEEDIEILDDRAAEQILPYDSDNSPFPQVRAVVSPEDDPGLPVNTIRMWSIGIIFTVIGSGLNQFFNLRQPSVTISPLVAQLITYPVGCAWAKFLPIGFFNPDHHFNIKEHVLITIIANVSFGSASATQVIEAIVKFYDLPSQGGVEVLFTLTTQLLGFGIAGISYRWLVLPATMIWPSVLSNTALFVTLHSRKNVIADGWKISRARFFTYVFHILFICWIVPKNVVVNTLFGQTTGLGMSLLTFDWAQVVYANQSPLIAPAWAGLNVIGGFVLFFWIVAPVLYYTNTWYTSFMPLMSSNTFDNTGHTYNTSRIINIDGTVNQTAYEGYSPMFLPAAYALTTNQFNLITEFIGGYAFLGKPIANMSFKFYGYVAVSQGLEFVANMKLGHYLHIPPQTVFWAQGLATAIGAIVQCGITVFLITRIDDMCDSNAAGGYSCPHGRVTYSSSLIWGVLGPGRSFSPGQIYGKLLWFFFVGPLAVIVTYFISRKWSSFRYVSWPVIFGAMGLVPPATGVNFSSWWVVNKIFNFFIKRRKPAWWNKYNYVLSAALDSGVAVATVIIYFCIILPGGNLKFRLP